MPDQPTAPWWQTAVIYQVYPRSFKDANGDGVGDLAGVIEKLDYLAGTLGVDAIWLSPFYTSPMADFGYDVADYTDVDPLFGDLETFDRLVAAAHTRGLKLIVDFVPNHSSDQHPWFLASRSSRTDPQRDWYVWRDPAPGGGPPNNWLSVFGGSAWTYDAATGQYYLHSFLEAQPDLNWRNPAVKDAMFDALRFWLDRGVDGFRIDVAHYLMKDPEERDNPVVEAVQQGHKPMGDYDSQEHRYDKGHADIHPLFCEIRALLDGYPGDRYSVGEIHLFDWDEWARYYGPDLDELHMPFNFALLKAGWAADAVRAVVDGLEAALPDGAWPNYVLGNHDETRLATRIGPGAARAAAVLLLTLRGTPTLYYGDELGLPEAAIPPEVQQDPWGLRVPGLGRDGCRTPMQWSGAHAAGFTTAETPWLPVSPDYRRRNVAASLSRDSSMLNLYRRLLALRKASAALQRGTYHPLDGTPAGTFAYRRETPDETIVVALNFTDTPQTLSLPAADLLLSSYPSRSEEPLPGRPVTLAPHEAVVGQL